jgi:hypothetical protein
MNLYQVTYYDRANETTKEVHIVTQALEDIEKYISDQRECHILKIILQARPVVILNNKKINENKTIAE